MNVQQHPAHRPRVHAQHATCAPHVGLLAAIVVTAVVAPLAGCEKRNDPVRAILKRRDQQQQATAETDHLREAYSFIPRLAEVDETAAKQQITRLLNSWIEVSPPSGDWSRPELVETLDAVLAEYPAIENLDSTRFEHEDVDYLRLNYLLRQISNWSGQEAGDDPLFAEWLATVDDRIGTEGQNQLRRSSRLFDWTIRNIQLEPLEPQDPAPPAPPFPAGLEFRGPGYRQTTLETLMRGSGDPWQRARVFIQLCRQAGIDACMLGLQQLDAPEPVEWLVGVRIDQELFLFEPRLGIPVPGPDQVGIATLSEARENSSVLRRMNVPGWFDYPVDSQAVQQTVALLDAPPESMSLRMEHLQSGLTGESRMTLSYDVDASGEAFDAIPGIAVVRLWPVAIQSRIYEDAMDEALANTPSLAAWQAQRWGMLTPGFPLALARWKHLQGRFDRDDDDEGARMLYMQLRHPEFEIEDLRIDVDLQQEYGIRRQLGQSEQEYDFQVRQIQTLMRVAKRAASYWLSLIHYDTAQYENARNWLEKRVLGDEQEARWEAAARYNLARTLEHLDQPEQADQLYRTIGDPQEHGNRIRARLLTRQSQPEPTDSDE